MDASFHVWTRRIGIALLVAVGATLLSSVSGQVVEPLIRFAVWAAATLGYLFIIVGIPFLLWTVGKTVFRDIRHAIRSHPPHPFHSRAEAPGGSSHALGNRAGLTQSTSRQLGPAPISTFNGTFTS